MSYVIFKKYENEQEVYGLAWWDSAVKCCPKCNQTLVYVSGEDKHELILKCPKCNETFSKFERNLGGKYKIAWGIYRSIRKEKRKRIFKEAMIYLKFFTPVILIGIIYLLFSFDAIDCNGSYNRNGSYNNNSYNRCKYTYSGGKKCTSRATRAGLCDYHYGIMEDDLDGIYDAYGD